LLQQDEFVELDMKYVIVEKTVYDNGPNHAEPLSSSSTQCLSQPRQTPSTSNQQYDPNDAILQLQIYLFLLDHPTMIHLCLLHHLVNHLSSIHLLILAMNLLHCLKLLQWYSTILYNLTIMFLFHVLQRLKTILQVNHLYS
jgi:hypothetical protein